MQKTEWRTEKQTYALFSDIEAGSVKEPGAPDVFMRVTEEK